MRVNFSDPIDIIVLNCDNMATIKPCIDSIIDNTPSRFNLVVIDQNSKDGSKEYLMELNKVSNNKVNHLILNNKNIGCEPARNVGFRATHNEWVAIIDSDIVIHDDQWLDKMWNYTIDKRVGVIEAAVYQSEISRWEYAGTAFSLINRRCLNEIGYFDTTFFIHGDLDWWARLEWANWKTMYSPDTNIKHIGHQTIQHGVLKNKHREYLREAYVILDNKYTPRYLSNTLEVNINRRIRKSNELSLSKGNSFGLEK